MANYPTDMFGFRLPESAEVALFVGSSVNENRLQQWKKPRGARTVYMLMIGSGGAGGTGNNGSAGTLRGGGAGGSSGGIQQAVFFADTIPDMLWMRVGDATSSSGDDTYVCLVPGATLFAEYWLLHARNGSNGGNGTGSAGGVAQSSLAGTLNAHGNAGIMGSAFSTVTAGAGSNGTAAAGSVSQTYAFAGGGGGGGGVNASNVETAGGSVTPPAAFEFPALPGGLVAGGQGHAGLYLRKPWLMTGGTGGGGNASGAGGRGGAGGIGCGGGGGGGGTGAGGGGGRGGPGMILVASLFG